MEDDRLVDVVSEIGVFFTIYLRKDFMKEFIPPRRFRRKLFHPLNARLVQRFKDIEGGKEKGPGTAGGVENGYCVNSLIEMTYEIRIIRVFKDVLRKLSDIQIAGDKVIDSGNLSAGDFILYSSIVSSGL